MIPLGLFLQLGDDRMSKPFFQGIFTVVVQRFQRPVMGVEGILMLGSPTRHVIPLLYLDGTLIELLKLLKLLLNRF